MLVAEPLAHLTAEDVMQREVITIPHDLPLREAARLLSREQIGGAPVVDGAGRCIGVLSATDFVRWAGKEGRDMENGPLPGLPLPIKGRLLTGEDAVICTQAEGRCPSKNCGPPRAAGIPLSAGSPTAFSATGSRWPRPCPSTTVRRYMTADVVTAAPMTRSPNWPAECSTPISTGSSWWTNEGHPIGIVSSTDILAAVAYRRPNRSSRFPSSEMLPHFRKRERHERDGN